MKSMHRIKLMIIGFVFLIGLVVIVTYGGMLVSQDTVKTQNHRVESINQIIDKTK